MGRRIGAAVQLAPAGLEHTDHAAWVELRRGGLGGSDVGPLVGMGRAGRYGLTAWQLYLDKTGQLPPEDPDPGGDEMAWFGHQAERVAALRFRMLNPGVRLARVGMVANAAEPWMRVSADRLVHGCGRGPCGWECKTRSAYQAGQWDYDGGDPERVPDDVAVQCHWAMMVYGFSHWHLSVILGGNQLRSYTLGADPAFHETLAKEAAWFWHDCVLARRPPPVDAAERTGNILARLWDVDPDKVATATPAIVTLDAAQRDAQAVADAAAAEADQLKHELMAWMADAEVLMHPDGYRLRTWRQTGTFRDAAFRADHPDLAAKYQRTATCTDTARLAADHNALYTAYRARSFLTKEPPKEK
jgi:predicted phage-related endonuclease